MATTAAWLILAGAVIAAAAAGTAVWARWRASQQRLRARRGALDERDSRLAIRESTLETKAGVLELREANLIERERAAAALLADLDDERATVRKRLEEIADFTADEARQELFGQIEAGVRADAKALLRETEARARKEATQRAQMIVAAAVQRVAVESSASLVTTTVRLPDDDFKGRIIGRDGRNIRAFEHATGVDLIVDDTPGAVVLSSFDPVRRETACRTLRALLREGRIQPASIEAAHRAAQREVDAAVDQAGGEAAEAAGVERLDPGLLRLLGQLEFRTSYGQNVRLHSIESAVLAGAMAEEIGTDAALARRCALLHDIGKAVTHRTKGSHAAVGAEIARRLDETEAVCHAIAAHHGEVEPRTVEAALTQAADAVSASRPGARRDSLEQHVARQRRIEDLCAGFAGVSEVHAMQAGRDVRVIVRPEEIGDAAARELSKAIAARIAGEVSVPGSATITVIRELRERSTLP